MSITAPAPVKIPYERWLVIPLEIPANEVVQIDYQLPANVIQCTGVTLNLSGLFGVYIPFVLGELSISLNDRQIQPICLPATWIPVRDRLDYTIFKVEQPLTGGTRVNGYFKNSVPMAYSAKVYLQCIAEL